MGSSTDFFIAYVKNRTFLSIKNGFSLVSGPLVKAFISLSLSITKDVHHRNKNRSTIKNVEALSYGYLITSFILHVKLTKCHNKL